MRWCVESELAVKISRVERRVVALEFGEGDTARGEEQSAVDSDTNAATDRAGNVFTSRLTEARGTREDHSAAVVRAGDVAFDTDHAASATEAADEGDAGDAASGAAEERLRREVVADVAAADDAVMLADEVGRAVRTGT